MKKMLISSTIVLTIIIVLIVVLWNTKTTNSKNNFEKFVKSPSEKVLVNDPAYQYFQADVPTQQAIARKMRVTAQRINQLYHTAKVPLILQFLVRFENIVTSLLS